MFHRLKVWLTSVRANAHAIIGDFDLRSQPQPCISQPISSSWTYLLPLSANTSRSVHLNAIQIAQADWSPSDLDHLAYTLSERRSALKVRGFMTADVRSTSKVISWSHPSSLESTRSLSPLPIMFLFTGQGAQWPQMGSKLIDRYPAFAARISYLDQVVRDNAENSLGFSIACEYQDLRLSISQLTRSSDIDHEQRGRRCESR